MKPLFCLLITLWCGLAAAHKPSDSYLTLNLRDTVISGRWDIALRDLDFALDLDSNNNGAITWGELRSKRTEIERYAFSRLHLAALNQTCALQPEDMKVDKHSDGAYAVLLFTGGCSVALRHANLTVGYSLFAGLDKQHRGLLSLSLDGDGRSAVLSPNIYRVFNFSEPQKEWRILGDFIREGVRHIAIGYDHILFLISLLIPSVMAYRQSGWQPVAGFKTALWDVIRIVTAFTLAHSITLSVAVLGYLNLPSRWVESAIAASVIVAALNNLKPLFNRKRALLAFSFGLVHGFGFAGVLSDLGLAHGSKFWSLSGFNLGVEMGQLILVLVFLPLAYYFSRFTFYKPVILKTCSLSIAGLATLWFLERGFDITIRI